MGDTPRASNEATEGEQAAEAGLPLDEGDLREKRHDLTTALSRNHEDDPADMTTPTRMPSAKTRLGTQFRFFLKHPNFRSYEWEDGEGVTISSKVRDRLLDIIEKNDMLQIVIDSANLLFISHPQKAVIMNRIKTIIQKYYEAHGDQMRQNIELAFMHEVPVWRMSGGPDAI